MIDKKVFKGKGYIATKIEDRYKLEFLTGGHFPYEEDEVIITKEELNTIIQDLNTLNRIVAVAKKREGDIGFGGTIKGNMYSAVETDYGFRYTFNSKELNGEEDYINITKQEMASIIKDHSSFSLIYKAAKKREEQK